METAQRWEKGERGRGREGGRILCFSVRCLSLDGSCVEALRVLVLELLARRGNHLETVAVLGDLMAQLDQCEPRTHWLYHEAALSPARLVREREGGRGRGLSTLLSHRLAETLKSCSRPSL